MKTYTQVHIDKIISETKSPSNLTHPAAGPLLGARRPSLPYALFPPNLHSSLSDLILVAPSQRELRLEAYKAIIDAQLGHR